MIPKSKIGINSSKKSHFKQGHFEDRYEPNKYFGERPIIYRSGLELKFMIWLEKNPKVVKWSSEKIVIPYYMHEKINGKVIIKKHDYFTDFTVEMSNGDVYVVEVKPSSQCPIRKDEISKNPILYKNACKWKAALDWCKQNGYIFKVITEKSIH